MLPCPVMIVIGTSAEQRVYVQSLLTPAVKMSHQKSPSTRLLDSNSLSTLSAFVATEKRENKVGSFQRESSHCIVIFTLKTLWKKKRSFSWLAYFRTRFAKQVFPIYLEMVQSSCIGIMLSFYSILGLRTCSVLQQEFLLKLFNNLYSVRLLQFYVTSNNIRHRHAR